MFTVKLFPKDSEPSEHIFEAFADALAFADDQAGYWQIWQDEQFQCEGP
jgi:hypothetical protein